MTVKRRDDSSEWTIPIGGKNFPIWMVLFSMWLSTTPVADSAWRIIGLPKTDDKTAVAITKLNDEMTALKAEVKHTNERVDLIVGFVKGGKL